jgi:hypothetical protein
MNNKTNKNRPGFFNEFSFDQMRFQWVEIVSSGILYRGVLIGADDKDIYLRGALRWLILPMDRITSIRPEGFKTSFNPTKQISADFYESTIKDQD